MEQFLGSNQFLVVHSMTKLNVEKIYSSNKDSTCQFHYLVNYFYSIQFIFKELSKFTIKIYFNYLTYDKRIICNHFAYFSSVHLINELSSLFVQEMMLQYKYNIHLMNQLYDHNFKINYLFKKIKILKSHLILAFIQ
jgi:hypothetical protein